MKTANQHLSQIVIFGRTNVGKSTIFNCLMEKQQAIVSDVAGTTRDANAGVVEWRGRRFELIDTGGIINLDNFLGTSGKREQLDQIQKKIEEQARLHLERATLILFVVDAKDGILPVDRQLANLLKKIFQDKTDRILLVTNKVDNYRRQKDQVVEFHKLALGEPLALSAATGSGTGDLLDVIVEKLPEETAAEEVEVEEIKAIIIGKPNVGKSSLLNSLLGEERVIVSPIAHTTREPQDTLLVYKDKTIRLIDTAGISRKGRQVGYKKKHDSQLEKIGIEKSLKSLEKADIALLVLDINDEITHQDAKIVEEIVDRQKSLIIIGNKWDLVETKDVKKHTREVFSHLPFAQWAPVLFLSAKTGAKTKHVLDSILKVAEERQKEISPSVLNTFLMKLVKLHRPTRGKGTVNPRIRRFEQCNVNPPAFKVRIGAKENLDKSYTHFIANRLREKFGFTGTPIRVWITKGRKVHGRQEHGRGETDIMDEEI